jgi:hypothetical protein
VIVSAIALMPCPAVAADTPDVPDTNPEAVEQDCRYNPERRSPGAGGSESWTNVAFPDGDVFRPLLTDPKQPQFFAQKIEPVGLSGCTSRFEGKRDDAHGDRLGCPAPGDSVEPGFSFMKGV